MKGTGKSEPKSKKMRRISPPKLENTRATCRKAMKEKKHRCVGEEFFNPGQSRDC